MNRERIERHQVWLYLAAILTGLAVGMAAPALAPLFETSVWPVLGILLYATFTQVPLTRLPEAFRDRRFMGAVLTGNFLLVPLAVWGLLAFLPDDPAIRLGVLLVLLVPCTDWFITFTHLGGGDTRRAIAAMPVNLLVQIPLLPVYLWLFMGETFFEILAADRIATVFVTLIVLPLLAAWLTERWAERGPAGASVVARLGILPVPLLALVVFLIAAAQVHAVRDALPVLGHVLGVFIGFLVVAAVIGIVTARLFALPTGAARTLIFSLGTRNSFVVLPLALALSAQWQAAAVVIVFQSLVELFGMVAYLWAVPRILIPDRPAERKRHDRAALLDTAPFACARRRNNRRRGRLRQRGHSVADVRLCLRRGAGGADLDGRRPDRQSLPHRVLVARDRLPAVGVYSARCLPRRRGPSSSSRSMPR